MLTYKRATEQDIDFIIEAIVAAEKSGTKRLSYATMFGFDMAQVHELLRNAVLEDIPGQELALSGFIVAWIDENRAAAVCSWIEAADEIPSAVLKANVLYYFLGADTIAKAAEKAKMVADLDIPRQAGTLQIESVYVSNKYRGLGVSNKLILEHIRSSLQTTDGGFSRVQIHVAETNASAVRAYEKLGFETKIRKTCADKAVLEILPADTRIMMELDVNSLYKNGLLA
ncbi:MAG: GNAT family N-acetyltransferase [Bacteroidota bacterium]